MPAVPKAKGGVGGGLASSATYPSNISNTSLLNSFGTTPRITWASAGEYLVPDSGTTQTSQFFATRCKTRISGGRWLALAPVFVCAALIATKSPFGVTNQPKVTLSFALELANGTLTPNTWQSPNSGGTLLAGTFNGQTDGVTQGGGILIGDLIYASSASLPYFQWTDRSLLPWLRVAWSKKNATDTLFAATQTEYNFPCNSYVASCTSFASAKSLIATAGISGLNSGSDHWDASDSSSLPTCIGFVGIPMDNQKSLIFVGTSILDGDGSGSHMSGGVDPANNSSANYDLLGFPNIFGENISNSVPVLNLAVGASGFTSIWSGNSVNSDWPSNIEDIPLQRGIFAQLAKYFDICMPYDVHNDPDANFNECINNFCSTMRASNPAIKIYACRVPNGYVDIAGSTVPYSASLDVRWAMYDSAASSGLIHGVISVREGGNIFYDAGTQVTSVTTSVGSTTTLNDSAAVWIPNQWINSFVSIGGVQRLITGNTRTQLTFTAYGAGIGSGISYLIQGNTTGDGIHPNAFGQRRLAANFKTAISAVEYIPYFPRST